MPPGLHPKTMEYTLVYDSDCGPCTRFRDVVGFLDAGHRMRFVGLDVADRSGILERVEPSRRHRSFHLVSGSREVLSGAAALPRLVGLIPGGRPLSFVIGRNPLAYRLTAFVYSTFSRLHDMGSCAYQSRGPSSTSISTLRKRKDLPHQTIPRSLRVSSEWIG